MTEKPWEISILTRLTQILADTHDGLTGREIGDMLNRLHMEDPFPDWTKWRRLEEAFVRRQNLDGSPKRIITFICNVMNPANYRDAPELFSLRQDRLNGVLTFVSLRVNDEGRVAKGAHSSTLDEASRNATSLQEELRRRGTHVEVLRYCSIELLKKNNFHASLEATKSVFERLRQLAGVSGDGAALVDAVLSLGKVGVPLIAINSLTSQTDRDEQTGVRGHEKVPTGGQVEVSVFGQVKVSAPCSSCRSGTAGPDGDGEGANQSPSPPGSSIEVCEGPYGHHFRLPPARVV